MHHTATHPGTATDHVSINAGAPNQPARTQPKPREKVLVCLHHDNYVEVYADKSVDVRIVNVPFSNTSDGAIAAEDYVELTIPRCYREIFYPTNRRAAELLRKTTASDIAYRRWSVELLRQIQSLGRDA